MSPETFWEWFKENEEKYFHLDLQTPETRDFLLELLLEKLHEYSDGLFFKIGEQPGEPRELVITAEGNIDYFEQVEELVAAAPEFDRWKIIAFKPALEGEFIVEYEGIEIDSQELWFLPMQSSENPKLFGVIIGIRGYDPEERDRYLGAVYQMLDVIIGEKTTTEDIHFLELDELPENPEDVNYIRLSELKRYIEWHRDGIVPFSFSLN